MMKTSKISEITNRIKIIFLYICILSVFWSLSACQTAQPAQPGAGGTSPSEQSKPVDPNTGDESVQSSSPEAQTETTSPVDETDSQNSTEPPSSESAPPSEEQPVEAPAKPEKPAQTEDEIRAIYQENPHAVTFVVDDAGQNNTCAQCHAPVNWMPSMDTIPESCLTCKFEIKDPPSYIAETEWEHIPCKVCHEEGKKGKIEPEIAWLAIAQIGEYAAVSSSTEICMKCHSPIDLPDHGVIQLGSAHADYTCTHCHDAHSYQASCTASGCHDQTLDPALGIAGHDADHSNVDCLACHDGSGMEIGPHPETGVWTTLAYKSHQIELAAPCQKCHFSGNTWGLSVVEE